MRPPRHPGVDVIQVCRQRQRHLRLAGRGPDRAAETGRVAGRKQLLGVRAGPARAGRGEGHVDLAVGAGSFAFVAGGGGGGGEYGDGLAPKIDGGG
jgi:hypothetical protein